MLNRKLNRNNNKLNIMKIIDYVEKIDDILSSYEDWMHGQDGEDCTNARVYLNEIRRCIKNKTL